MKKGNDPTTYLFMAGAVAIVAIVALVLSNTGSLEGAAFFGEKIPEKAQNFCVDEDPDNDFFKKGTVRFGVYLYEDHCEDDYLHQHYCGTGTDVKHSRHYECPNGCSNGACLFK